MQQLFLKCYKGINDNTGRGRDSTNVKVCLYENLSSRSGDISPVS